MAKTCKQCGVKYPSRVGKTNFCLDCAPSKRWSNLIYNYGVDKRMYEANYIEQPNKLEKALAYISDGRY